MKVQDRFLKYVSFTTTSDEESECCPSTKQQLELAKFLTEELEQIGLSQVKMDENGYVYGLLPATEGRESDTPIGFISHMDTSPDFSGVNPNSNGSRAAHSSRLTAQRSSAPTTRQALPKS